MLVVLLLAGACAAAEDAPLASGATQIALGGSVTGSVKQGEWVDYFVRADNGDEAIHFKVVATTKLPTALSVYAIDGFVQGYDSSGAPLLTDALHGSDALAASSAAAIDADTVSRLGDDKTKEYHVYISQCYLQVGAAYFLSIRGVSASEVSFTAYANRKTAKLATMDGTEVIDTVCDGKYLHHFWDLPTVPAVGGVQLSVSKRSGELEAFYLRHERCAGASGSNVAESTLSGHGLSSGTVTLPSMDLALEAGRYYVSVRGSADMCGTYAITLRNLTQVEVSAASA